MKKSEKNTIEMVVNALESLTDWSDKQIKKTFGVTKDQAIKNTAKILRSLLKG